MAQITHLMQAKAAFDAACLDIEWAFQYYGDLAFEANRIQDVLEEAEKRCIRVLLEEEETPAMMMIQEEEQEDCWLTSVKHVAADMRAHARKRLLGEEDDDEPQHGCNKLIARMKPPCLASKVKTTTLGAIRLKRTYDRWLYDDDDDEPQHGCNKLIARMKLPCLAPKTTEADILEKISGKLEALMEEYEGFGYTKGLPLAGCCTEQPSCVGQQSIITDVPLGRERDDDKQRIIRIITQQAAESRETETDQPVILPIFGPAGIGKTTLVKSIFNDPELFQDYAKAWVDTPEVNDLKKIYTSIISSSQALLGGAESPLLWNDGYSADAITNKLAELFRSGNKKLLLVLDDLWVEASRSSTLTKYLMKGLKSFLGGIGRNLVLIVTTHSKNIAGYITSNIIKPYQLHPLSHDTCWEIMKRTSGFEARNDEEAEAAERIGRVIASKCCGLPLAAKALGRTLCSVDNPQHWLAVVGDSQGIWNTGGGGYPGDPPQLPLGLQTLAVLSHLKQAYHLSHQLWLCFATYAFCISKGRSISRYDLRWLWGALYIISPYCDPSYHFYHSLFRENSASNASAVLEDAMLVSIDDMMYDFARYVLGDRLIVVDGRNGGATVSPDVNRSSSTYLAVISNWDATQRLDLSSILPAGILALRFEDCQAKMELRDGAFVFSSAEHLLALDLSGCSLKKLPESIGQLKRLRYLNAPRIQDRVLPMCLTRLHWLGYLILRGSPLLSDLTEAFGRLNELSHLDLSGCSGLKALPDSFGRLNELSHLDLSGCSGLKALPDSFGRLNELGHLDLSGCSGLKALPDSFGRLNELRHLDLSGCSGLKALPDSFGRIAWLEHLDLSGCSGLKALPDSFGRITWLKHLDLSGCSCVEALQMIEYEADNHYLRYLNLSHRCGYSSVEDWFHLKDLDKVLPKLKKLWFLGLSSCLNPICYTSTPDKSKEYVDRCIKYLVKLQHLDLSQNKFLVQLPESIGDLKQLRSLDLSGCFRLESIPESIGELEELCTLDLSGCFRLERLPGRIGELEELCTLNLSGCFRLESIPESISELEELCTLDLSGCFRLERLPERIGELEELCTLNLSGCFRLESIPESIGELEELCTLDLSGCFRLERLPERIGELEELCTLNLSGCFRLERLPERIGELKTLETLDLSGCPQFDPLPENVETKLAKLRYQGSLTIITDGKVYHLSQESAHEDHSQQRCIVASDDQAQSRASTPQDASFVDESSAAEPEITEATDEAQ